MNYVKHHTRKRDTTIRCYTCTKLGHLAKNCRIIGRVEDEKKEKVDNIINQMRQKWIPKPIEEDSPSNDGHVTQDVGDSTISN